MYNEIDLDKIDISKEPPTDEPARQYYFMAKCREWVREFEKKNGRRPFFFTQTFGCSMNSVDPKELSEARDLLLAQKPLVQAYVVDQVRDKMLSGEATVGVIYSGELLYLQEEAESLNLDYDLEYVIPEEGTNIWIDSWVIPYNARNKENAEKWINFLCRPDIAKKNFEYITYATPNQGAFELLDKEYQDNTSVFPDTSTLTNSEVYQYLGTEADDLYSALWKEIKSH